jgi:hypothetical protein
MITIEEKNDPMDIDKDLDVENKKSKRYYSLNLIYYHQMSSNIHYYSFIYAFYLDLKSLIPTPMFVVAKGSIKKNNTFFLIENFNHNCFLNIFNSYINGVFVNLLTWSFFPFLSLFPLF